MGQWGLGVGTHWASGPPWRLGLGVGPLGVPRAQWVSAPTGNNTPSIFTFFVFNPLSNFIFWGLLTPLNF